MKSKNRLFTIFRFLEEVQKDLFELFGKINNFTFIVDSPFSYKVVLFCESLPSSWKEIEKMIKWSLVLNNEIVFHKKLAYEQNVKVNVHNKTIIVELKYKRKHTLDNIQSNTSPEGEGGTVSPPELTSSTDTPSLAQNVSENLIAIETDEDELTDEPQELSETEKQTEPEKK